MISSGKSLYNAQGPWLTLVHSDPCKFLNQSSKKSLFAQRLQVRINLEATLKQVDPFVNFQAELGVPGFTEHYVLYTLYAVLLTQEGVCDERLVWTF